MDRIKIALVQESPVFLNKEESLSKAERLAAEAAENAADVVIFPETWVPGYPLWIDTIQGASLWDSLPPKRLYRLLTENSVDLKSSDLDILLKISKEKGLLIVLGVNERRGKTLYNSMIYIHGKESVYVVHRKLVPTYTERLIWGRGDGSTLNIVETPFGNVGGLICWEHFMPLARAAMYAKNEILHVAQWPSVKEVHLIASRNYAFEGSCYVAASGTVLTKEDVLKGFESLGEEEPEVENFLSQLPGEPDTKIYNGGSCLIAPDSSFVLEPEFEKMILYAEIDIGRTTERSMYLDPDGHYSRPDIFTLKVNTSKQENVGFEYEEKNE